MNERVMQFRIGMFVIVTGLVLTMLIVWFEAPALIRDRQFVTVYFADREPLQQTVEVPANSRMSLPLSGLLEGTDAGAATTAHAGVTVRGRSPAARLYAEQATYGSTATERWARGAVARGER